MKIKGITDECFTDYKEPGLYIAFPRCSFKCDIENGAQYCQNAPLTQEPDINVKIADLIYRFDVNPITKVLICGGLEPFDSEDDLYNLIFQFRQAHSAPIIIYTGYTYEEVLSKFTWITLTNNLIIKFGRFRPNQSPHYDETLGVQLANDEQYAKYINWREE